MREVSLPFIQAAVAQDTSEVLLPFIKIEHPDFAAPIRLTCNTESIVRADGEYKPYGFRINMPKQVEDDPPQMQLEVDNTDLAVNNAIRAVTSGPTVTFEVALASSPDVVEAGPFVMGLHAVQANVQTITGTLGYEQDLFAQSVPAQQYLPTNSPGLYL